MNFPAYVPAAVRSHVSRLLPVITDIIDTPRAQTPRVVREYFQEQNKTGDYYERRFTSFADEHLATIIEKRADRRDLELHKECLIRLGQDERLREAYGLLVTQFSEDESWHKLVWAAATATLDFETHRIGLFDASELCNRIGAVSDYLAFLLRQVKDCHVWVPSFYSFSALINGDGVGSTDDDKLVPDSLLWLRVEDVLKKLAETACVTGSEIANRSHNPSNPLAWRIAYTEYNSPQNTLVMSALKTRQSNPKTEYLRAFGCGLTLRDPDALTAIVQKAMADIATVVINHPDIVVTYDDVRAVFAKGKQRTKGKSSMKCRASFRASRKTPRAKEG